MIGPFKKIYESEFFKETDQAIRIWMQSWGYHLLRISLGIVFLWFGLLKFFPDASPAYELAVNTISTITFGALSDSLIINLLAAWEVLIGIGLITGRFMRFTLLLLFLQMPGTFLPAVLFPEVVFKSIPFVPTLEGQYIFKNLILISAGIVLGGALHKVNPYYKKSKPQIKGGNDDLKA